MANIATIEWLSSPHMHWSSHILDRCSRQVSDMWSRKKLLNRNRWATFPGLQNLPNWQVGEFECCSGQGRHKTCKMEVMDIVLLLVIPGLETGLLSRTI